MRGMSHALNRLRSAPATEDAAGAARWFHRFLDTDVSGLTTEELADWAEWSEAKSRLDQVRKLDRIWTSLGTVVKDGGTRPSESAVAADEYDADEQPISEWIDYGSRKRRRWNSARPFITFLAAAACLTIVIGAVVKYGHVQFLPLSGEQVQSFATAPSEHRSLVLPDRSRIVLGARTQLTVHYTSKQRLIFLDHGEASFSVMHSSLRPFTVFAGGGSITALGTEFDVRREVDSADAEHVVVTVSSGSVEVGPPAGALSTAGLPNASEQGAAKKAATRKWTPSRLMKGQELTYSADGPRGRIETVNLEEVSAWEEGRLEYRRTPFRDVIPRVNRYSEKHIVLADDGVADLTYTGTVFEGQVEDWLHALRVTYPIEVTESDGHYVLRYDRARDATAR